MNQHKTDKIMSLDVSLHIVYLASYDGGKTHEEKTDEVFSANITHNLGEMARKAGIYNAVWRPYRLHMDYLVCEDYQKEMEFESSVPIKAKEITPILKKGLNDMVDRPEYYKQFNSPNGWGMYKDFVPWLRTYLSACVEHPESVIYTSR